MISYRFKSLCECSMTCGFLSSRRPREERCNACGKISRRFGEFCSCGAQNFSHVCPLCGADVVVDHPETVGPHELLAEAVDGGANV